MLNTILFFSSDNQILFKKDILTVISLPQKYAVHFRYSKDDLSDDVYKNFNSLKNRDALILYAKGNSEFLPIEQRQVQLMPIRRARIISCRTDTETELFHFNLELNDFLECDVKFPSNKNQLPPYKFVIDGTIINFSVIKWYKIVEQLIHFDISFQGSLFFNVKLKKNECEHENLIWSTFDLDEETSYFKLSEQTAYILNLAIFISETNSANFENHELRLEYDKKDIIISNPSRITVGSQKDNRKYKLITKSIDNIKSFDYLKILSVKKGLPQTEFYETILRFNIRKNKRRASLFIILLLLNFIGTASFAWMISKGKISLLLVCPIFLVIVSALGQYFYYNKKG